MKKVYLNSAPDEVLCVPCNPESESLFKPYCPVYTCRVFNETEIVQDPDGLFLYIFLSTEKVCQEPEILPVQLYCKCIDCKVPSVQVFLY